MSFWDQKCLNLGIFWPRISKRYCHFWNQCPWFCLIAKFQEIIKMPKFGTKSLMWVFWDRNFKKLLSYLKSVPSNLSNCKISWKNKHSLIWDQKCLNLAPKMPYFGLELKKKNTVIFEISVLQFVLVQSLVQK